MRFTRLRLSRFKAFEKEDLELAPITLLTGANSSGKTSVLQALCAIAQGRESIGFPFEFRLNGPLVRLGDFRNAIHGHKTKGSFEIGLEIEHEQELLAVSGAYRAAEEGGAASTRSIRLEDRRSTLNLSWNQKQHAYFLEYSSPNEAIVGTSPQQRLADMLSGIQASPELDLEFLSSIWLRNPKGTSKTRTTSSVLQEAAKHTNFDAQKLFEFLEQQEEELKKGKIRLSSASFPDAYSEAKRLTLANAAIGRARSSVARLLRQTTYVGAVRAHPLRYYAASTANVGFDPYGEGVSLRLAQWKESNRDRFNEVKAALVQLELATDLRAEANLGEFVQVKVTPKDRSFTDTIADVGFGLSQVLPVLVADIGLGREGTVLINQPEVHLHPSSQALLGNYFASRVSSRQYVIETHSEYLVTRFRILVAQKKLSPNDVALYFVSPTPDADGRFIQRIELNEKGEMLDAPPDFFRTYVTDSYQLAMSAFDE